MLAAMDSRASSVRTSPPASPTSALHREGRASSIFKFNSKQGKIDFRSLGRLDIAKIRNELDVDALQSLLANVTFAAVEPADISSQTDESLCHLVRYMQSCLEYMMYVQLSQAQTIENLQGEVRKLQSTAKDKDAETQALLMQLRSEKKASATLQSTFQQRSPMFSGSTSGTAVIAATQGSGAQSLVFKCELCSKAFRSKAFLDAHVGRRHPGTFVSHEYGSITAAEPAMQDPTVVELRTQRELLAKELAARNAQLSEALAATRSISAAAIESMNSSLKSTPLVERPNEANAMNVFASALTTISGQGEARMAELRAEVAALRESMRQPPTPVVHQVPDVQHAQMFNELRLQMAELEQAVVRELETNRAVMNSHAGALMDDVEKPAPPAPWQHQISEDDVVRLAAAVSAEQVAKVQSRVDELQHALQASENARAAAEAYAKAAERVLSIPKVADTAAVEKPAPVEPPVSTPVVQTERERLPPAAKIEPQPVPPPAAPSEPFLLSYQWQRLPDTPAGWHYPAPHKALASLIGAENLLPPKYSVWLPLLPATVMISKTKPPRVRIPPRWELDVKVANRAKSASIPSSISIQVDRTTTVRSVRELIALQVGMPVAAVTLVSTFTGSRAPLEDAQTCEEVDIYLQPPVIQLVQPISEEAVNNAVTDYVLHGSPAMGELGPDTLPVEIMDAARKSMQQAPKQQLLSVPEDVEIAAARDDIENELENRLRVSVGGSASEATRREIEQQVAARLAGKPVLVAPSPVIAKLRESGLQLQQSLEAAKATFVDVIEGKGQEVRPHKVASLKRGVLYAAKYLLESSLRASSKQTPSPRGGQKVSMQTAKLPADGPILPPTLAEAAQRNTITPQQTRAPSPGFSGDIEDDYSDDEVDHAALGESIHDNADAYEAEAERMAAGANDDAVPLSPSLSSTFGTTQISDLTASQLLSPMSPAGLQSSQAFVDEVDADASGPRADESLALSQSVDNSAVARTAPLGRDDLHHLSSDSLTLSPGNVRRPAANSFDESLEEDSFADENIVQSVLTDVLDEEKVNLADDVVGVSDSALARIPSTRSPTASAAPGVVSAASRPPSATHQQEEYDDIEEEILS